MTGALPSAFAAAAQGGAAANAKRWYGFLAPPPGHCVELQALQVANPRGGEAMNLYAHAPDQQTYAQLSVQMDRYAAMGVYTIPNVLDANVVAARSQGGEVGKFWPMVKGASTTDKDIRARSVLYIDLDAPRPSGISATDEELAPVFDVAAKLYLELAAIVGYDAIALGHSGNGCSLFLALAHLLETPELRQFVGGILHAVKMLYATEHVKIDAHLSDPKRLVPAFGTIKRKGPPDDVARPHRRTAILTPDQVKRLSFAELQRCHDTLVSRCPQQLPAVVIAPSIIPDTDDGTPAPEDSLELGDLRKRLVALRRKKANGIEEKDADSYHLLTAILNGTALATTGTAAEVPGVFSGRSKAINKAAWLLAFAFPAGTAWEIAVEFLRPSMAAMDCSPEGLGHWLDVAEKSYDKGLGIALEKDAKRKVEKAAEEEARQALLESVADTLPQPVPNTPGFFAAVTALAAAAPQSPDDDTWMLQFIRTGDHKIKACAHNVYLFLTHSPAVKGTIRFNDVTNDIEVRGGPFATMPPAVLATAVMNWVHKVGRLEVGKSTIEDQLLLVAYENRFDPIKDYLKGLVWDGVPRLADLFFKYLKARRVNADGIDISEHLRRIGHKWPISACARALFPGVQMDTMLVLEGMEGEGKTSALRRFFKDWYVVAKLGYERDDHLIQGAAWGVEIGELASSRKGDDELLKQHLSTTEDIYRVPYGRRAEKFKRRNVLIGTTNDEHWLTPGKGRRRYWPVYLESVDLVAIDQDLDQLWAEAVMRLLGFTDVLGVTHPPERWHLEGTERTEADTEAGLRIEDTVLQHKIRVWYLASRRGHRQEHVTLVDIIDCLQIAPDRANSEVLRRDIGYAMTKLGFEKKRRGPKESRVWAWVPPESLKNAE